MPYVPPPGFTTDFGLFTPGHMEAAYQTFKSWNAYRGRSGLYQMPVAGPDTLEVTCKLVRGHAPVSVRVYHWVVEREGLKPLIPSPESPEPANEVFDQWEVTPENPDMDGSGGIHVFKVRGWYSYLLLSPRVPGGDTLRMGGSPADVTSPAFNVITPGVDYSPLQ